MSDKTISIKSALLSAKGKTLMLTDALYDVADKIEVDLDGADIEINSRFGSKILSTASVVTNDIEIPEGALHIKNAGTVRISGLKFEAANTGIVNYLNGLLISDCSKVILDNVTVSQAPFGGIRIAKCDTVSVVECSCSDNLYAGLMIHNCKHITILGGNYHNNGRNFPANGYGINIGHREGTEIDNEAITILGVKAYYNYRKGIDIHGGVKGSIMGCHVKGFGNSGIYAVAEAGSDPDNPSIVDPTWLKHVKDWIIANNTVENDPAWYNARCSDALNPVTGLSDPVTNFERGADGCAIFFGAYGNGLTLSPGSFDVHDNIIRNCNVVYSRGHIFAFTNFISIWNDTTSYSEGDKVQHGFSTYECIAANTNQVPPNTNYWTAFDAVPPDNYKIHDNTIMNAGVTFPGDAAIHVTGIVHPKSVEIYNNIISGTSALVINVPVGESVNVHGNTFKGSFTDLINIDYNLPQRTWKNTYNGKPLPDMASKDNGTWEYSLTTSGSAVELDTIKVNAGMAPQGGYNGGMVLLNISIVSTAYNQSAVYEYNAYAGNDNVSSVITDIKLVRRTGVLGDPANNQPILTWVPNDTTRTLKITFNQPFSGNFITIKISGWRLHPKGV